MTEGRSLIRTGAAARLLGVSAEYLRTLANKGVLPAVVLDGVRHFRKDDVLRLRRAREARRRRRR